MKSLCDSCRTHWMREENEFCEARNEMFKHFCEYMDYCPHYDCMPIIEREDDGTERCGMCGALHLGWDVCPNCGADYRPKREREVTRVYHAEITRIDKNGNEWDEADLTDAQREMSRILGQIFNGADDVKCTGIQQFVRDGE